MSGQNRSLSLPKLISALLLLALFAGTGSLPISNDLQG